MLRRLFVFAFLLLLCGCCCPRNRCNPCDRPNPCDPCPPEPPPGEGDYNCSTWASDDCDSVSTGVQSRPWLLDQIELRVNASTTLDPQLKQQILNRINKHRADKNCRSNTTSSPDCATNNQLNCICLLDAFAASMVPNWPEVSTKLAQGH